MNDGCLVVFKPKGLSSHDIVAKVRRAYKVKAGHSGTLDPMAQGVLVVFLDKALKLLHFLPTEHLDKTYLMRATLGSTTDTYDATGKVTSTFSGNIDYSKEEILNTLRSFVGTYQQTPPAFSAIKVNGKRAYAMARAGEEVELASRTVHVTSIRLVSNFSNASGRHLVMRVHCSRGTYVRPLAYDLGQALGCGAHLSYLLRERVGTWSNQHALPLWQVEKSVPFQKLPCFTPFPAILPFSKIIVKDSLHERIRNGAALFQKDILKLDVTTYTSPDHPYFQVFSKSGKLLGIYGPAEKPEENGLQKLVAARVFG